MARITSMWRVSSSRHCCAKLELFLILVFAYSTSFFVLSEPLIWEDEDTEYVQALPDLEMTDGPRWKRQFPGFPANFPGIPGWPGGISGGGIFGGGIFGQRPTVRPVASPGAKPGQCKTMSGEDGVCKTMRQCYPVLYYSKDSNDLTKVRNPALLELYQAASTPCQSASVINHLYFRADIDTRQSLVCCPQKKPWTPPTGIKVPQTTRRPGIPGWPSRPVGPVQGGPGGHRPPTKRPVAATTTTTPATTSRPWWATSTSTTGQQWTTSSTTPWWMRTTTTTQTSTTTTTTQKPYVVSSCGQSLIVGGSEVPLQQAGPGMYPWMASMVVGRRHVCGGSLIDSRHVLTAAHCVAFMQPHDVAQIRVLLGDHDLSTVSDTQHVVKRVKSLARHRGFTQATLHHDIALLILDSDVDTSHLTNIRPICLTNGTRRYDLGNTDGVVAGWGSTQFQGNPVSVMRHVTMRIWTNAECRNKYGALAKGGISDGQVCAGSPGRDACRGDSGGPLMIRSGPTYEQVGLVSWGIECGTYPGVYTRVDKYRDWIEKNRQR